MKVIEILENASSGATGAGSVASTTGGFDPNGQWRSIYSGNKKKTSKNLLIRRNPKAK